MEMSGRIFQLLEFLSIVSKYSGLKKAANGLSRMHAIADTSSTFDS
jgi:hypothetical protein